MKNLYIINIFFLFAFTVKAQQWTWTKSFPNSPMRLMDEDTLGNIYLTKNLPTDSTELLKLDINGNPIWSHSLNCIINKISVGRNNLVVAASYSGTFTLGAYNFTCSGLSDGLLISFDLNGNVKWAKHCNGLNNNSVNSVEISNSGNIFTAATNDSIGTFSGVSFVSGFHVCVFDSAGLLLNNFQIFSQSARTTGLTVDNLENVYLTGLFHDSNITVGTTTVSCPDTYHGGYFIAKLQKNGSEYWAKSSITDYKMDISNLAINSNYEVYYTISETYDQEHLFKLSPTGNLLWKKTFGSTMYGGVSSLKIDKSNNIYAVGSSWYNAYAGNCTATGNGNFIFVLKADSSGACIWSQKALSNTTTLGQSLSLKTSSVTILGRAFDNVNVQLGQLNVLGLGFIARISENVVTTISQHLAENELNIFPNPSNGIFQLETIENNQHIKVYNILGDLISEKITDNSIDNVIDLNDRAKGIYFVEVINLAQKQVRKILIE